jgi:hypothetical protein
MSLLETRLRGTYIASIGRLSDPGHTPSTSLYPISGLPVYSMRRSAVLCMICGSTSNWSIWAVALHSLALLLSGTGTVTPKSLPARHGGTPIALLTWLPRPRVSWSQDALCHADYSLDSSVCRVYLHARSACATFACGATCRPCRLLSLSITNVPEAEANVSCHTATKTLNTLPIRAQARSQRAHHRQRQPLDIIPDLR